MKCSPYGQNIYYDEPSKNYIFNFCISDPFDSQTEYDLIIDLDENLRIENNYFDNNRGIRSLLLDIFYTENEIDIDSWFLQIFIDYVKNNFGRHKDLIQAAKEQELLYRQALTRISNNPVAYGAVSVEEAIEIGLIANELKNGK